MLELLALGCTGVVVIIHSANFFFHTENPTFRSLSFLGFVAITLNPNSLMRDFFSCHYPCDYYTGIVFGTCGFREFGGLTGIKEKDHLLDKPRHG